MGIFFEKKTRKRSKPLEVANILMIIAFIVVLYYGFTTNFETLFLQLNYGLLALFSFLEAATSIYNKEGKGEYFPWIGLGVVLFILVLQQ